MRLMLDGQRLGTHPDDVNQEPAGLSWDIKRAGCIPGSPAPSEKMDRI